MTEVAHRIRQALDQAELEIRQVGADAFRTGEDEAAAQARDAVEALKALRSRLNGQPVEAIRRVPARRQLHGGSSSAASGHSSESKKYPRYEVRSGALIRVGWSKKQKAEYEHKVPRDAFDRTVKGMAHIAQSGRGPFTADKVVEYANDSNLSVPSYQVYVVIGLLRDHGCVEQVGREGYVIPEDVAPCASKIWNQLTGDDK